MTLQISIEDRRYDLTRNPNLTRARDRRFSLSSTMEAFKSGDMIKARESRTGKFVAIILCIKGSDFMQEVEEEIKIFRNLHHVNVVRIFGYEISCEIYQRECIAFSQQLAMAAELFDFILFAKKFTEREALTVFKQIIQGLEAIHKSGAIHGNLTPKNVLFDVDYNVKLCEFGFQERLSSNVTSPLAQFNKSEEGQTKCMSCVAPEILNGKKPSAKSDIFSSGVILFIMLAGCAPFKRAIAKDWWFDKLMKSKFKLFWMAIERTAKFSNEAKDILQRLLAAKEDSRIDIQGIKDSRFWCKSNSSTSECVQEIKRRKIAVIEQARKNQLMEGVSRSGRHMMSDCQIFQGDLANVSESIKLQDLVCNSLREQFESAKTKSDLMTVLRDLCDMYGKEKAIRNELFSEISDENVTGIAEILSKGAELGISELAKQLEENNVHLMDWLIETVDRELRRTRMGIVEDYSVVMKFSDLDETVSIPSYDAIAFKGRCFSYRTKIGFGLLGFACSLFVAGRGMIRIHPTSCSIDMTFNVKRKLCIPAESAAEGGSYVWKNGRMPMKIVIHVELAYDEQEKINVAIFEHKSNHYCDISEFGAILEELTSNPRYWLRDCLQRPFTKPESFFRTNILRDVNQAEEEVEDYYHEVVLS